MLQYTLKKNRWTASITEEVSGALANANKIHETRGWTWGYLWDSYGYCIGKWEWVSK